MSDIDEKTGHPLDTIRHSTAHLMAAAVQQLYPGTLFGVGPVISNGFYYDIKLPNNEQVTPEIQQKITKAMQKLCNQKIPFERKEVDIDDAIKLMSELGQTYKVELLQLLKTKGTTSAKASDDMDAGLDGGKVREFV